MPSALVTGATGMVGSTMIDYILENHPDYDVVAMRRDRSDLRNVTHLLQHPRVHWEIGDLADAHSQYDLLRRHTPDRCFHTAAMSHVPTSRLAPAECMKVNVIGQINLFEALRQTAPECRIQICGSSEQYGLVLPDEIPVKETNSFRPLSPYACSKISQDMLGYQYARNYGMKIVRTRAFNHSGARRHEAFSEATFSIQIAQIEKGMREPVIEHGNLTPIRDMTHVRDIVRAYWMSLDGGCVWGEAYNICSGIGLCVQDMLDYLTGLTPVRITTREDPARVRPSDVPILIGDSTRFREATGWTPRYNWQETLSECLDYWRGQI
ncbi:MAG: GDP-mannose 4,6-dehydratase [candidate division Zixibacteria bacterium]|nr:GDP-mannose 4,6-dehydratase [candidate division Zixibacteria bacterium]